MTKNSENVREFIVDEALVGVRLDSAVSQLLDVNRSMAVQMIKKNLIEVLGEKTVKSLNVKPGMLIRVLGEIKEEPILERHVPLVHLSVIYEDSDFLVVDKPADVAAHPSVSWEGADVVTSLAAQGYRISTSGPEERKGIVHRLDVGTSGLMAVAKSEHAYSVLKDYFRNREVTKIYHTLVQGMPDPLEGTIDAPIGRHPHHDWKFAVLEGGRESVTHYELVEAFGRATLLEVHLETGRTHQIRVHFAALNHPCVGDPLYGSNPKLAEELGLKRQWLHAHRLGFVHPSTGEYVEFLSPYPQDLEDSLEILRNP